MQPTRRHDVVHILVFVHFVVETKTKKRQKKKQRKTFESILLGKFGKFFAHQSKILKVFFFFVRKVRLNLCAPYHIEVKNFFIERETFASSATTSKYTMQKTKPKKASKHESANRKIQLNSDGGSSSGSRTSNSRSNGIGSNATIISLGNTIHDTDTLQIEPS